MTDTIDFTNLASIAGKITDNGGWKHNHGFTEGRDGLESLIGKICVFCERAGDEAITLIFSDGTALRMQHHQDCCETVEIEDLNGDLADLLYTPLLVAEERTNESGSEETGCSQTWTFYTLRTIKGSIDIRWLGESNGYYSESVHLDIGVPEIPLSHHAQMALIEDSKSYRSAYGSDGKEL